MASTPSHASATAPEGLIARLLRQAGFVLALAAAGGCWWWLSTHHFSGKHDDDAAILPAARSLERVVQLPPGWDHDGGIALATAEPREMQQILTVPGRLGYDARHLLVVRSQVEGVVTEVFVRVREAVQAGTALAVLSSPDVGLARNQVESRQAAVRIASRAAEWASTVAGNVEALVGDLRSHPPLTEIQPQYAEKTLGENRERIIGSYSTLLHAERAYASTEKLGERKLLAERLVEERQRNLQVARAAFLATCEEAIFDTRQARDKAEADLNEARRLLEVARRHLTSLIGPGEAVTPAADREAQSASDIEDDGRDPSRLTLRTPQRGIVEDVFAVVGQHVHDGERLFVVADTAKLWVEAAIHERQWTEVEVTDGEQIRVTVPGGAVHEASARVTHVGATVEEESRSVPLIAELDNDDAHYKPGMFVWVDLPQGEKLQTLAVPSSAVMRHEGQAFVFVPAGENRFERIDIRVGIEGDGLTEVLTGLEAGRQVVSQGAFLLKSELLLEQDEGE